MNSSYGLLLAVWSTASVAVGQPSLPLFEQRSAATTGISFANTLQATSDENFMATTYFFNGGGVAVGDVDNDGRPDLFFTGNQVASRLYRNTGQLRFADITAAAGLPADSGYWATGATMADVNADGWLDIYVCYTGSKDQPDRRRNRLYINRGDGSFVEQAAAYGLDDTSYGTQAVFFDYDGDHDPDMFLVNYNADHIPISQWEFARQSRDPDAGDKLYRNDGGRFTDVSEAAGIRGSALNFGLSATVADVNGDHRPDIYVTNDFVEPDYLYINRGDGTFSDQLPQYLPHISHFSMGADIQDFNNDLLPDVLTLDMLPADNRRQKLLYGPDNYEEYARRVHAGYHFQHMRNMLHLNNGNGPDGYPTFSEIGQLAGVSNTDWSWSALGADYDNDGDKDLFVTNGYYKDVTDRDFLKFKGDYYFQQQLKQQKVDTLHLVEQTQSTPLANYIFQNNGDLSFRDRTADWGLDQPGFSNGAAYADLDNDGDLDLVVNNINQEAGVYENVANRRYPERNFLQFQLLRKDSGLAYNAKVTVYADAHPQYAELQPVRGFQSSVSSVLHFGLDTLAQADSVKISWSRQVDTTLYRVAANQRYTVAPPTTVRTPTARTNFPTPLFTERPYTLWHQHAEPPVNDFKRQPLLLTMPSITGPVLATADVDQNGTEDLFIGGSPASAARLLLQDADGKFLDADLGDTTASYAATGALFFDADGDQDPDLLVAAGGYYDYSPDDEQLRDRLYLNDGEGNFKHCPDALPDLRMNSRGASTVDFDHDGDLDLFVGGHARPGAYPISYDNQLLLNDGHGRFHPLSSQTAAYQQAGLVTDSYWHDFDGDGWPDLMLVGEFMPVQIYRNEQGRQLIDITREIVAEPRSGLWSEILAADFDQDGDPDFVLGNFGRNSQLRASPALPMTLYYDDFDDNGSVDPLLTYPVQDKIELFASREDLLNQMIGYRRVFPDYQSYASAGIDDLLSAEQKDQAKKLRVDELRTTYLENRDGRLVSRELPVQAQFSPVSALVATDADGDGDQDIILAGNQSYIRIRLGVVDANFGMVLLNDGAGHFTYAPPVQSGLQLTGDCKSAVVLDISGQKHAVFGINNSSLKVYQFNEDRN